MPTDLILAQLPHHATTEDKTVWVHGIDLLPAQPRHWLGQHARFAPKHRSQADTRGGLLTIAASARLVFGSKSGTPTTRMRLRVAPPWQRLNRRLCQHRQVIIRRHRPMNHANSAPETVSVAGYFLRLYFDPPTLLGLALLSGNALSFTALFPTKPVFLNDPPALLDGSLSASRPFSGGSVSFATADGGQ